MNPDLAKLQPYPFEKLARLKQAAQPPQSLTHIALSIGEPKHPTPAVVRETLHRHSAELARYPQTRGGDDLREAIAAWLEHRYGLDRLDPAGQVLPVNGTREALFAFAQAVVDRSRDALVLMPNPFYQIYEGAALLAGAQPVYLNLDPAHHLQPDFDGIPEATWRRCQLLYLCSPGNPTGAVMDIQRLQWLIEQAQRYDFVIAADECYAEIYPPGSPPPPGLLQAAAAAGNPEFNRCIVFHSLSKRSNAPGLRSGFVAGDAKILERFLLYRTYHGCAMSPPVQAASSAAWRDEEHVKENRSLYARKFDAVLDILRPVMEVEAPDAAFYFWPRTPEEDTAFTRALFEAEHVTVLPGSYLSREADGVNPGAHRVRMALVADEAQCIEAAQRIRRFMERRY